jgi:hypothetical protein
MKIVMLGIDLGKNLCSLAGLDQTGAVVLRRRLKPVGGLRTSTAYSIALASERSPVDTPSAVAGGIRLPTLRIVKRSPGWLDARRSGITRLSEQVMNSASGFYVSARSRNLSAYCGSSRSRKSTIPIMSLRTHQTPLCVVRETRRTDLRLAAGRGRRCPEALRVGDTG